MTIHHWSWRGSLSFAGSSGDSSSMFMGVLTGHLSSSMGGVGDHSLSFMDGQSSCSCMWLGCDESGLKVSAFGRS